MEPAKELRISQEQKLFFSWDNIVAKTDPRRKWNVFAAKDPGRMILDHVSGEAKNGEILAILGESGAGKTTLLNLLSGRTCQGVKYDGKVKINRQDIKSTTLTRLTSFVKQFEDYIPYLTVKEHLLFYAILKLRKAKQKEILEKIDSILTEFMLQKCSNSLIGIQGYMRTLSGGEYKRLVLATETISDTPIILCDEPTTGLDSRMAYDVVSTLKYLASLGKVIICTIHQPSSGIVAMFDRIMLMHDARVAYSGQVPDAITFFDKLGYKMKNNTNPADFFIKCLAIVPGNEESCKKRTKIICDSFKDDERSRIIQVSDEERSSFKKFMKNAYITTGIQSSFWTQMKVLAERELKMKLRVNKRILGNTSTILLYAIAVAICYQKQELTDVGGQNMVGILFCIVISLGFFPLIHEIIGLALQLQLVYKEQQKYLYSSSAFLLSVFLIAILWYTVTAIPVLSIMYFSGDILFSNIVRTKLEKYTKECVG